ncbi:MAG: hypothetical protein RMJ51_04755 [Candidatus Calescibacterium sp.]|nr:hypothetical protein [Candidatus Calescibacterium sp.]MDW8195528.1 hypothetical protein [Candidatus Calescibacterium sp.]
MSSFEQRDPRGEKLYKKPEYIKPPPSDKQKLVQTAKKLDSITEIVDLERESLIKTIERLKNKANIVELILNHGSLTGKMILKNGIIIDVSLDEYTEIEAIIYLIQITEEDLLSYLPMFLRKKLEEENLLDTLESIIKYRPQDMKFEIDMEEDRQKKINEDNPTNQDSIAFLDDIGKEIEALLLEIDDKENSKKEKTNFQEITESPKQTTTQILEIESKLQHEEQSPESENENSEEYLQLEEHTEQIPKTQENNEENLYTEQKEESLEIIEIQEKSPEYQEKLPEYEQEKLKVEEEFQSTLENQITIEENEIAIEKEIQYTNQIQTENKEEKTIMVNNLVNKLSQIPPIEEFHIINIETEELEYCSNESLDDFSVSTIIAAYKDISMFSSFSSEKTNNIVLETEKYYYIITSIDDTKIVLSKCSKKSNPSLISSLINKAIKK